MLKIPRFALWLLLAVASAAIPLACSSNSTPASDAAAERAPVDMTSAG